MNVDIFIKYKLAAFLKIICIIMILLVIIFIPIHCKIINTHLSSQFNIINFKSINIEDSKSEVCNKLGDPLIKYEDGNGKFRLIYSTPKNSKKDYFLFMIRFDNTEKVIEKYFGIPD